jgi:hypothetical protein
MKISLDGLFKKAHFISDHPILSALEIRRSDRLAQEFVKRQKERFQE